MRAPLTVVDAIGPLGMLAQVDQTLGAHSIALGLRSMQDMRLERRLLARSELFRATGPGPVVQAVRTLGIEALDGIVRGLTFHSGQPGGFGPGHALQGISDGEQSQAGPSVLLASGSLAQIR